MIAVDTNILIYAHNPADPLHCDALTALRWLSGGGRRWAVPLPCLVEFYRLSTHPRVLGQTADAALSAIDALIAAPGCAVVALGAGDWPAFAAIAREARARGNLAFDTHIAAACRTNGVRAILTEDRDFRRFDGLRAMTLADNWRAST